MDRTRTECDAQAIDWLIRQRDPAFDDWDGFTDWLEADPAHGAAFHAAGAVDAEMGDLPRPVAEPVPVRPRAMRRIWQAGGAAVAAMLVGLVGYGAIERAPDLARIATAPGERRMLTLADGSTIALNGGTRIAIDRDRPRYARLEEGEAMFRVVHRATDPFVVEAGGAMLRDVGTAFDVVRRDRSTQVAVSEGAVVYDPDGANVRVDAGRQLDAGDDGTRLVLRPVVAATVGSWRQDQLVYDGAPLSVVVADVARATGVTVTLATGLGEMPFRGMLRTGGADGRVVEDLAGLAGLRAVRRGDGWVLMRGGR